MEKNSYSFQRWYSGYIALLLFVFLLVPKFTAFALVLFLPLAIIGTKKHFFQFKINRLTILFFIAYGFYLTYCFFTRHPEIAVKYLEYKLSFLLIPVLFSFVPKEKMNVQFPIVGFLIGTVALLMNGMFNSYTCYSISASFFTCFTSSQFSPIHHPSYSSIFYTVSLFLVWYAYSQRFYWMKLWGALFLSLAYTLAILFCFSLAGLLFFFCAFAITLLVLVYYKWGRIVTLIMSVISPILLVVLFQTVPVLKQEFNGAKKYLDEYLINPAVFVQKKQYPMSGSEVRLVMWTASFQALLEYPFGVGTGNVDEVLAHKLIQLNQHELAKQALNPHNQYLQTGLEVGIIGLLAVLAPFVYALRFFKRSKNWLLLLVVGSLLFNMLFESMLQRQSGIVFFTLAVCMLVSCSETNFSNKRERLDLKK